MTERWLEVSENPVEGGGVRISRHRNNDTGGRWAPWRLESIEIRDALVAIQVTPVAIRGEDEAKAALAAMVRAIGLVLADHGLLRPLVVYLCPDDPAANAVVGAVDTANGDAAGYKLMKAWEDDQDWHRGRFVLFIDLPPGLLEPKIHGFARTTEIRPDDDISRLAEISQDPRWADHDLWAKVSDWAAAVREKHGRSAPNKDATRDLDDLIAAWGAAQPLPPANRDLPMLVLASYSPDEPPPLAAGVAPTPEAILYFPATADEDVRSGWDKAVSARLYELRGSLQRRRLSTLAVHARCTPALAIRAGAVFHASTGLTLAVVQRKPGTQQDELWRLTEGRAAQLVDLRIERLAPAGSPTELQLRVSATRPVDADADAWTGSATPMVNPYILRVTLPQPGDDAVHGPDHAWDIARSVRAALIATQADLLPKVPVRIFFAGPTALAVWLGAQLNAVGTVILMDWMKSDDRPHYVVSFTFQPGA